MKKHPFLYAARVFIPAVVIVISLFAFTPGFEILSKFFIFQIGPDIFRLFASFSYCVLAVVAAMLLLTFLFGRFYCSFLCPLGILQEILCFVLKKKAAAFKNFTYLRYAAALISFMLLFGGCVAAFRFLDPFSNFGAVVSNTFTPVYAKIHNIIFSNSQIVERTYTLKSFLVGFIPFLILILFVIWKRRVFCVAICPVGTLLGFFSKWGLFKLNINGKCIKCGKCESFCYAGCIDFFKKSIDNERCVRCLKCLEYCPVNAVDYRVERKSFGSGKKIPVDSNRRNFVLAGVGAVIAIVSFKSAKILRPSEKSILQNGVKTIYPPGAGNVERFMSKCTSCQLCVQNCKGNVLLAPNSKIETVHLDYDKGFCQYNCNNCSAVCPTGALKRLTLEQKKVTRIGMAKFEEKNCISCGICAAKCPVGALSMEENGEGKRLPNLNGQFCIGCGACQFSCPAPSKAFKIIPIFEQGEAAAPRTKELIDN
jgi:ferredoxin